MKTDDGKQEFTVTAKAGPFVAGQRSPGPGKTMRLTEEQAQWALHAGELERAGGVKSKPKPDPKPQEKDKAEV